MQLFSGTSGFSYKEWRGEFYAVGLPEKQMLSAYASRLPTVEINNTFYRMPQDALLDGWATKVPAGFSFALKAPRRITHLGKLRGVEDSLQLFLGAAARLSSKQGPLLFQLPPTFKHDGVLLEEFVSLLPSGVRAAFEFRHPSWFTEQTYACLAERQIALCGTEVEDDEGVSSPFVRTAPFTYIRLRRLQYDVGSLERALARIAELGVDEAFVYLKHEVMGPSYALTLLERAASSGASVAGAVREKGPPGRPSIVDTGPTRPQRAPRSRRRSPAR